jgi:hypothetical protein
VILALGCNSFPRTCIAAAASSHSRLQIYPIQYESSPHGVLTIRTLLYCAASWNRPELFLLNLASRLAIQLLCSAIGFFALAAKDKLTRVVFLCRFKLNLLPYRLNLPPPSFRPPDQIPNEKPFEGWNQRHREDEKNTGERGEIK